MKINVKVLVEKDYTGDLKMAVDEATLFLKKYANVSIVHEKPTDGSVFISLGDTRYALEKGAEGWKKDLTDPGFVIKSVENGYCVVSPTPSGVLFGTYSLLHELCEWEAYAEDEVHVSEKLSLPELDILENPSFQYRETSWVGWSKYGWNFAKRTRRSSPPLLTPFHCHFFIMPPSKYLKDHPDWYSEDVEQLCITNEEMTQEFIKNCFEIIKEDGFKHHQTTYLFLGQEDGAPICKCPKCQESDRLYGGPSGTAMLFINKVAKAVNEFVEVNYPGKTVKTVTPAYCHTKFPPVDENMEPAHPSLMAEKNVGVMFAPLNADYTHSLFDREANPAVSRMFEGYFKLGIEPYVWTYDCAFDDIIFYTSEWEFFLDDFRRFREMNCPYIIDMCSPWPDVAFDALKTYVRSKLLWNLDLDKEKLIDDFFANYYKKSAPLVRQYFNEINAHLRTIPISFHSYIGGQPTYKDENAWPKEKLLGWIELLEDAEKTAENPEVALRVTCQKLTPLYILLEDYANDLTKEELKKYVDEFERGVKTYSIRFTAEHGVLYMNTVDIKLMKWRSLLLV